MQLTYNPTVFNISSIAAAMAIILTPEDSTTEIRWKTETPYLADLIGQHLEITSNSLLLDYGCGIGRMTKELIERHGCYVIGVDSSPSMRAMAPIYVASDRFLACPSVMLEDLIKRGIKFDCAISIWVLQHCAAPSEDISRIRRALRSNGGFFVLNAIRRCVPTVEKGWVNDGIDLKSLLGREFTLRAEGTPAVEHTSPNTAAKNFWAAFRGR